MAGLPEQAGRGQWEWSQPLVAEQLGVQPMIDERQLFMRGGTPMIDGWQLFMRDEHVLARSLADNARS